jgi:putative acetyltransferase
MRRRDDVLRITAKSFLIAAVLSTALLCVGCKRNKSESGFSVMRADRQMLGPSKWPLAVDPAKVGTYPADTKSGAGYFYDDVLEYRVWVHPDKGGNTLNGDRDWFIAFAQYEPAKQYSDKVAGAEPPLVLVRQLEWIDEPNRGQFIPKKGERITEWQVDWLKETKRTATSIQEFLKHPIEADPTD